MCHDSLNISIISYNIQDITTNATLLLGAFVSILFLCHFEIRTPKKYLKKRKKRKKKRKEKKDHVTHRQLKQSYQKSIFFFLTLFVLKNYIFIILQLMFKISLMWRSLKSTTILTSTKILLKKQNNSPVNFQIILSTYKLNCQNKNLYSYLRGFPYLDSSFFQFKNVPTVLCLSKDKTKG